MTAYLLASAVLSKIQLWKMTSEGADEVVGSKPPADIVDSRDKAWEKTAFRFLISDPGACTHAHCSLPGIDWFPGCSRQSCLRLSQTFLGGGESRIERQTDAGTHPWLCSRFQESLVRARACYTIREKITRLPESFASNLCPICRLSTLQPHSS